MRVIVSDEIADLESANRTTERLIALYESDLGADIADRAQILADLRVTRQERLDRIAWFEQHWFAEGRGTVAVAEANLV